MKSKARSSSSLLRILGAVGAVALIVFLTLQQANFLLSRGMLIAFGDSETTYRSAWFEWDGDVVARDVVIHPYNLSPDVTIRFERAHLETPGWFWFVRNTFDRKLKHARLDRIHLTLEGGSSDTGFDPSLGDLGPFGLDSASPFEAEGCAQDAMWVREELVAMGLDPQPPKLEFDYRVERNELLTSVVLETRGASRVQLDRRAQLPTAVNALLVDQYPHRVLSERWDVQDQGFVQARNRHCAKKDGVEQNVFLARHAASVSRLMEAYGIAVDERTRSAYLAFARRGGRLTFGGDYSPPIGNEEFYELRDAGEAWPRMRNASIANGAQTRAVQWQAFEPRPLAGLDDGDATWAALQRELVANAALIGAMPPAGVAAGGAPMPAGSRTDSPASSMPAAPGATAAYVATATAPPGGSPAAATTMVPAGATASTTMPAPTGATASPAMAAPAGSMGSTATAAPAGSTLPAAAAPTPSAAVAGATATTTASAATGTTGLATTSPASAAAGIASPAANAATGTANAAAGAPTITALAPQPAGPRAGFLAWQDMAALKGQKVRLWTLHNPPRLVEVLSADADALRISTRLGGGNAEYTVHRSSFLKARQVR